LKERVKLQDLGTIEKIMLNWILQVKGWKVVGWNDVAQNKDKWRTVVNKVMNIGVP
jgi:hypothetical protein